MVNNRLESTESRGMGWPTFPARSSSSVALVPSLGVLRSPHHHPAPLLLSRRKGSRRAAVEAELPDVPRLHVGGEQPAVRQPVEVLVPSALVHPAPLAVGVEIRRAHLALAGRHLSSRRPTLARRSESKSIRQRESERERERERKGSCVAAAAGIPRHTQQGMLPRPLTRASPAGHRSLHSRLQ